MVLSVPFLILAASVTLQAAATVEWISRPRSRLYVNAGETAKIDWKFVPGALAVVYDKKATSLGVGTRIAHKPFKSPAEVMKSYKGKIVVEKSGALKIINAGLSDEGFYSIRITYKSNTLEDEVEIKIQEAPTFTSFPSHGRNTVYYRGMTIELICMARGRPLPDVEWYKDNMDSPLVKSKGSILHTIQSATKKDTGKYTCLASNQAGKANRTIEFIIYRRPYDIDFFHNTALDGTIFEGQSVIFTCSAKGSPPITHYKLLHNGRYLTETFNGMYKINEVRLKHNGTYSCVPINKAGLGENRTTILRVQERKNDWKNKLKMTTITPTPETEAAATSEDDETESKPTATTSSPKKNARGTSHVFHPNMLSWSLTLLLIMFFTSWF